MALKGGLEHPQMLVGLDALEALLASSMPAAVQRNPIFALRQRFCIPAHTANDAVHALDDVGAGQRAAQVRRQAKPVHGQDLVQTFEDGFGDAWGLLFKPLGEVADQTLGFSSSANRRRPPGPCRRAAREGW